jgi:muramoyltetrapeptide carboxypeptidase
MDMFADSTIDAIMCARGGTGSLRLLEKLDYKLIKRNPKPFVGFSDITVLLQAINRRGGFATYHGPMLWNLANEHDPKTLDDMLALIGNKKKSFKLQIPGVECICPGRAEGKLVGGNMTLLQNLIGTPYDWSGQDAILFLEDVDEVLYKLDRMLNHFRLAGKFEGVQAIIVGEMVDVKDGETGFARKKETPYGRDLKQIILENIPAEIPLCMDFPCGHGKYLTTLPVGAQASLNIGKRGVELSFTVS